MEVLYRLITTLQGIGALKGSSRYYILDWRPYYVDWPQGWHGWAIWSKCQTGSELWSSECRWFIEFVDDLIQFKGASWGMLCSSPSKNPEKLSFQKSSCTIFLEVFCLFSLLLEVCSKNPEILDWLSFDLDNSFRRFGIFYSLVLQPQTLNGLDLPISISRVVLDCFKNMSWYRLHNYNPILAFAVSSDQNLWPWWKWQLLAYI